MWCDLNSPTNHACQQSFSEQNSSYYHWRSSPNPIRWIPNNLHHICLKLPRTATFISGKFCPRHSVTLIQNCASILKITNTGLLRPQLLQLFSKNYSQLQQIIWKWPFFRRPFWFFFCFTLLKRPKAFIWGIIFFCTMDGFFRILEKTASELICTQLYILGFIKKTAKFKSLFIVCHVE